MKFQYIRAFIVLLAGLIALIVNMHTGKNVTVSLAIVLVVILIFYVIATLVVEILQKNLETSVSQEQAESDDLDVESRDGEQMDLLDEEAVPIDNSLEDDDE